jgi:dTMP kinase
MSRGYFISIEGGEGVGKTTALNFLQRIISETGIEAVYTREPGGTPYAEKIRHILLEPLDNEILDPESELLLMFAARLQHVRQIIYPRLEQGKWVISDRFIDATYAYQGGGRGIPYDKISLLEKHFMPDLKPDLTLFLDARPELVGHRIERRKRKDRIEHETLSFFDRVYTAYHKRQSLEPDRIKIIDATLSLSEVELALERAIAPILSRQIESIMQE